MSKPNVYPEGSSFPLSCEAMKDLHRVAKALESIEIQMSVLSIQMQYDNSRFSHRTIDLTRDVSEIHDLLDNILAFGS